MTLEELKKIGMKAYQDDQTCYFKNKENEILKLEFTRDDFPQNPREWDNLGTMITFWNRENLGDGHQGKDKDEWFTFFREIQKDENKDKYFWLPIFVYEHSGITISTRDFGDKWDSGFAGFIYVSKKDFLNQTSYKEEDWKKEAERILRGEIETYRMYLEDDVYGFILYKLSHFQKKCPHCGEIIAENDYWEEIDSCCGFYGSDIEGNGMCNYWNYENWEYLPNYKKDFEGGATYDNRA